MSNTTPDKSSLVLVLYTGGTVGMKKLSENEPCILHLDLFIEELKKHPLLHDVAFALPQARKVGVTERLAMPAHDQDNSRILYDIKKAGNVRESKDTCTKDWMDMATEIANTYEDYDGFVILHGTDTMAYTASALSFMLENLGKPVVLTGAQTPIYEKVTDAKDNLAGALLFAGYYAVSEVTIFFNGKLFRGNRSTKVDAISFSVFDSPSCPPLAKLSSDGVVEWNYSADPRHRGCFTLHTKMSQNIALLPVFPGIPIQMIKGCLEPSIEGVVLVTYGSGNIPDSRTDLIKAIKEATGKGVVIVTCCPCRGGPHDVSTEFVEKGLVELGVVPGGDMTVECALTKVAFVVGLKELTLEDRKSLMVSNLRGEISTSKR